MPRAKRLPAEIGVSGLSHADGYITEEWLGKLKGTNGKKAYRQMADNDPDIGAFLNLYRAMSLSCPVEVQPAEQDSSLELVDFVEECIEDLDSSMQEFRAETLEMLVFGFSLFEIVYKQRDKSNSRYPDRKITWDRFAPRAAESIYNWKMDNKGHAVAAVQRPPTDFGERVIPLSRCLHFRTTSAKNNPEGKSMLRNAYRAWYQKTQLEDLMGIAAERDATGVPVLRMPEQLMTSDTGGKSSLMVSMEKMIQQVGTGYRNGIIIPAKEQAHQNGTVVPTGWDFELTPGPGKKMVPFDVAIPMKRHQIFTALISQVMTLGQGETGSLALAEVQAESLRQTIDYIHAMWCNVMNTQAIPKLMALNGYVNPAQWPRFHIAPMRRGLDETYLQYMIQLTTAGYLTPDENITHKLKNMLNLPVDRV